MPWIQLRLNAGEETAEKYSNWLSASGAQAVTFLDAKDTPIYEPLPGDDVLYWNNTIVMGPGGYRFGDYWRMGLPLEILVVAVGLPAILFFWPLST